MVSEVSRFLLVYDHDRDQLVDAPRVFVGEEQVIDALDAYDEAEWAYADQRDRYEVLLAGAESMDAIRSNYGRFFRSSGTSGARR